MSRIVILEKWVVLAMAKGKKKSFNKKIKKVNKNKIKVTTKKVETTKIKKVEPIKIKNNEVIKITTSDKDIISKIDNKKPSVIRKLKTSSKNKNKKEEKTIEKKLKNVVLENTNEKTSISVEQPKVKEVIKIFEEDDIIKNKEWAIIAYLFAPLVYLFRIDSKYVLYHARRGMFIFVLELLCIILYTISKEMIQISVSCANFATFSFTEGCKANPWWLTFGWGIISLIIMIIVTNCIAGVLREKITPEENMNFN